MNPDYLTRSIDSPKLGNQYLEDSALQSLLKRQIPADILNSWDSELKDFGNKVLGDILQWGRESENQPPRLTQFNAWGERVDKIEVTNGWKELQKVAAKEGLISIAYERKDGPFSRILQFVKIYLFHPSSGVFDCPLAMTDGATRALELNQKHWAGAKEVLKHLTSRDPDSFWTSGQWMTEKNGGSDVSNSETIAKPTSTPGEYELTGYKFFTSAVTSDMALTLARVPDEKGNFTTGSRGLSCFFIRTHTSEGKLNNIKVHKLKNKLGTRAVPTAELELCGSKATLLGPANRGVPVISTMLNITRAHNAVCSVAVQRRAIAVARDYAGRRKVFSKLLSENALHTTTLSALEVEFRGNLQFVFEVIGILGRSETGKTSQEEEILLRLLTPLLKLYTAKHAISIVSECIECLGGTGYMEDSDLPRLLRDSQVGSIWEGTTNVLSHDIWRPIRSQNALAIFLGCIEQKLTKVKSQSKSESLNVSTLYIEEAIKALERLASTAFFSQPELGEAVSRQIAFSLSRVFVATLLCEQAAWSHDELEIEVARRYTMEQPLVFVTQAHDVYRQWSQKIAMDYDSLKNEPRGVGEIAPDNLPRSRY